MSGATGLGQPATTAFITPQWSPLAMSGATLWPAVRVVAVHVAAMEPARDERGDSRRRRSYGRRGRCRNGARSR